MDMVDLKVGVERLGKDTHLKDGDVIVVTVGGIERRPPPKQNELLKHVNEVFRKVVPSGVEVLSMPESMRILAMPGLKAGDTVFVTYDNGGLEGKRLKQYVACIRKQLDFSFPKGVHLVLIDKPVTVEVEQAEEGVRLDEDKD